MGPIGALAAARLYGRALSESPRLGSWDGRGPFGRSLAKGPFPGLLQMRRALPAGFLAVIHPGRRKADLRAHGHSHHHGHRAHMHAQATTALHCPAAGQWPMRLPVLDGAARAGGGMARSLLFTILNVL